MRNSITSFEVIAGLYTAAVVLVIEVEMVYTPCAKGGNYRPEMSLDCEIWWCPASAAERFCLVHNYAYQRTGNPIGVPSKTPMERFWEKVEKTPTCWIWHGTRMSTGHGRFFYEGTRAAAHRVAYAELIGPIPEGLVLDHLCMNPPCVNPAHLEPVTSAENLARAVVAHRPDYCPQGHPYDEANTDNRNGRRICIECRRTKSREYQRRKHARVHLYGKPAKLNADKTHCAQGHPYDHTLPNGKRQCRTCNREAMRRFRAKQRS